MMIIAKIIFLEENMANNKLFMSKFAQLQRKKTKQKS